MLQIQIVSVDECKLILYGILDISTVEIFHDAVNRLNPNRELTLDFSGLEFTDSTGIGAVLDIILRFKERDISVLLTGMNEMVRDIFESVGVFEILEQLLKGA